MQSNAYVEIISSQISCGFDTLMANWQCNPPTETAEMQITEVEQINNHKDGIFFIRKILTPKHVLAKENVLVKICILTKIVSQCTF